MNKLSNKDNLHNIEFTIMDNQTYEDESIYDKQLNDVIARIKKIGKSYDASTTRNKGSRPRVNEKLRENNELVTSVLEIEKKGYLNLIDEIQITNQDIRKTFEQAKNVLGKSFEDVSLSKDSFDVTAMILKIREFTREGQECKQYLFTPTPSRLSFEEDNFVLIPRDNEKVVIPYNKLISIQVVVFETEAQILINSTLDQVMGLHNAINPNLSNESLLSNAIQFKVKLSELEPIIDSIRHQVKL